MGSPEFRVASSPDREVSIELLPEEGPKGLKGIPFEFMTPGTFLPGQEIEGNPHLTRGLEQYAEAMRLHSCTLVGNEAFPECRVEELENGGQAYSNFFADDVMPDPYTELRIVDVQPGLRSLTLVYNVTDPLNPDQLLTDTSWTTFIHQDSAYSEECQFANKSC
jgi:hypothetical protein